MAAVETLLLASLELADAYGKVYENQPVSSNIVSLVSRPIPKGHSAALGFCRFATHHVILLSV
jgi:hypothetical protein